MNLYELTSNFIEVDRLISDYLENGEEDLAENLVKANKIIADEIKNKSNNNVEKQNISNVKDENETYIIEEEEEILR